MQLGGKPPKKSSNLFDDDFASGFEEGKFDRFKPALKVITILIVIAGLVTGGVWAYSKNTTEGIEGTDSYSSSELIEDDSNDPVVDGGQDETSQEASPIEDNTTPSGSSVQKPTNSQSGSLVPSSRSNYDPSKCKGLESEYKRLEAVSDSNYAAFNNALNSAKIWGDIYEEMGRNKSLTDQAYKKQQTHIEELQETWKNSLNDQNNAYSAFQKCQAGNN